MGLMSTGRRTRQRSKSVWRSEEDERVGEGDDELRRSGEGWKVSVLTSRDFHPDA